MLEQARVIFPEHHPSIPPEVTYGLNARGQEPASMLDALDSLVRRWADEDGRTH